MRLSNRILMNVNMVPTSECVADVGCDHGYAGIYLIENKIAKRVIATDINKGPLKMAEKNISDAGLRDFFDIRCADGLKGIRENEVDTVIIAGMGSRLMIKVLKESENITKSISSFVLQPQSEPEYFRKSIEEMDMHIEDENACIEDGKYYFSMLIRQGRPERVYSETELFFGPKLMEKKDKTLKEYLERIIKKDKNILDGLREKGIEVAKSKIEKEYEMCRKCLKEVFSEG